MVFRGCKCFSSESHTIQEPGKVSPNDPTRTKDETPIMDQKKIKETPPPAPAPMARMTTEVALESPEPASEPAPAADMAHVGREEHSGTAVEPTNDALLAVAEEAAAEEASKQAAEELSRVTTEAMQLQIGVAVKEVEGWETNSHEGADVDKNVRVGVCLEQKDSLKGTDGLFTRVEHAAGDFVTEVEQVLTGPMDESRQLVATEEPVEELVAKEASVEEPVVKEAPVEEPVAPVVAQEVLVEEEPVAKEAPAGESVAKEAPAGEPVAKEAPVGEPVAKEAPLEEPVAKGAPLEEPVAKEVPVEEHVAKEVPVEERVAKEAPVKERVAKEALVELQDAPEEPSVEETTEEPVSVQLAEGAEVVTHQPKDSDFSARISWTKVAAVARLAIRRTMTEASIIPANDGQQQQKLGLALVLQGICCQVVGVSQDGAAASWNAENSKTPLTAGATQIWAVNNVKGDAAAIRDELQRATVWNIKFTTFSTVHTEDVGDEMDPASGDGKSFVVLDTGC